MSTPRPDRPVATIMSWPVATIDHDATLEEAAEALAADNIGALLVTRDDAMVGIISERDVITHLAAGTHLTRLRVGEAMAGDVVTVAPGTTILAAARTMVEADVRHLPVLDGRLIAGLVSVRDLLEILATSVADEDVVAVRSGTRVVVLQD